MELKSMIESVFVEAYKTGKCDGVDGITIKPSALFELYWGEHSQTFLKGIYEARNADLQVEAKNLSTSTCSA